MKRSKLRENGGFTLVELIVVIAILGILAGVGGVAYAGYVQKANQAVDEQLVADVKYAAILGGMQEPDVTGRIELKKTGMTVTGDDSNATAAIQGWLTDAFGDSWADKCTKVMEATVYVPVMSVALTEEQQQWVQDYIASNLYGHEEDLAESVSTLSGMFSDWLSTGGNLSGVMGTEEYKAFVEKYGLEGADSATVANAVVMYVASKASGMDAATILSEAQSGNVSTVMTKYGTLPSAALLYGVMTGYANSEYASEEFKTAYATKPSSISDVVTLYNKMTNDSGAEKYMNSESEKNVLSDMNGYLGALELVNDNADKFDITDPNVFNNNTTLALLQGILGG